MKTHVSVGWSHEFKLRKALLLYGESSYDSYPYRKPFATIHDVVVDGGEARLAAGRLLTLEMLESLISGLGQSPSLEILPEHVLAKTPETLVWWAPAAVRPMFFADRGGDETLRRMSGKRYPHPPLVFRATGTHLCIRALAINRRPASDTRLCMAPYWNCYGNGAVCTGSMAIPEKRSVEAVGDWERSFFHSAFSHAAGAKKHTKYPNGLLAMWGFLQGRKRFPCRYLVPLRQTLKEFVVSNDTLYRDEAQNN